MNPTAKEILESAAYKKAVDRVRGELLREFQKTEPKNRDALSDVAYRIDALGNIDQALQRELRASINLQK